jgi:short subunit dehydrogenase-like uncharacterized protein
MKEHDKRVVVFGAYGHTGRFVVAELIQRGLTPILSGRDSRRLGEMGAEYPQLEKYAASTDDRQSLDATLSKASAVINCAGPFIDTAPSSIEAAIRNRVHYADIAAEQRTVLSIYNDYAKPAHDAGIIVLPGMAFYGGLADLLATAAAESWKTVDKVEIYTALDSWHSTRGHATDWRTKQRATSGVYKRRI